MNDSDSTRSDEGLRPDRAAADLLERYELLEQIGRGGMGVVYKARHKLLDKTVAIKVCPPEGQTDRFRREARLAARVRSPHVVTVHDFGQLSDGRWMFAMDWIDGSDLAALAKVSGGALAEERVVKWMRHVCQGMQAAADEGVIHRDLKPSNILIDPEDAARVADFGLARAANAPTDAGDAGGTDAGTGTATASEDMTVPNRAMGTPLYMSPEQAADARRADTRSDIYSFGATFYHVLTRHPPFSGDSHHAILLKHQTEPLVAPKARNPDLEAGLGECLERCLAKSPQERFQSFNDVLRHLHNGAGAKPWDAPDDPEVERHLEEYRRRRAGYLIDHKPPGPDSYTFPHGRSVVLARGNLVDQWVDALVSSDDDHLSMGGGVSAALRNAAGAEYHRDAQRLVPVRHGRAVVTPAGLLPARFVFHAVTIAYNDNAWGWPSRDIVNELMDSCFYHADTLGVRSIAFPLLGTGVGMLSPDVCLDTMFRFLARKFVRGATTVREARIILYR